MGLCEAETGEDKVPGATGPSVTAGSQGLYQGDTGDLGGDGLVVHEGQVEEHGHEVVADLTVELARDSLERHLAGTGVAGVRVSRAPEHIAWELIQQNDQSQAASCRAGPVVQLVRPSRLDQRHELCRDLLVDLRRASEPMRRRLRRGEPEGEDSVDVRAGVVLLHGRLGGERCGGQEGVAVRRGCCYR